MKFRPYTKRVREIFGGENSYIVPNFQRDFSWKKANYDDFLNDLLISSDAKFSIENNFEINVSESNSYFFGTIIVVGIEENKKDPFTVIDGQQRLTTMTLFISAIREIISKIDSTYKHSFNDAIVYKKTESGKEITTERLKNDALVPVLSVNILNTNNHKSAGTKHEAVNKSQELLEETYELITKKLSKRNIIKTLSKKTLKPNQLDKLKDQDYIAFLDKLGIHLLNSIVVIIYAENQKSANVIYRNYNSRGMPLSQIDLIKNELFAMLDDETNSMLTLWENIENNIYKKPKFSIDL